MCKLKRSLPVAQWNQAKECVKGSGRMVEELDNYISSIKVRLYQIHRELEESGKKITADRIKDIYMENDESKKTLLQLFDEYNNQCRQLIGKDFVAKTVQRYKTKAKYVREFLEKKYKISDIYLSEVTPAFIQNFKVFLKIEKGCAQNAATTRLKNIKKMYRIALENDWVRRSPFVSIKFKREPTYPEFLSSHSGRHSYATSVCLTNGVSMENVAKMLGHSDTKMTHTMHGYWIVLF